MVMTLSAKVYSETLSDPSTESTSVFISKSNPKKSWFYILISVSEVEKDLEEESSSEIDKADHPSPIFFSNYTFTFSPILRLHNYTIEATHLFANTKASDCPGLYILYESIVI